MWWGSGYVGQVPPAPFCFIMDVLRRYVAYRRDGDRKEAVQRADNPPCQLASTGRRGGAGQDPTHYMYMYSRIRR